MKNRWPQESLFVIDILHDGWCSGKDETQQWTKMVKLPNAAIFNEWEQKIITNLLINKICIGLKQSIIGDYQTKN